LERSRLHPRERCACTRGNSEGSLELEDLLPESLRSDRRIELLRKRQCLEAELLGRSGEAACRLNGRGATKEDPALGCDRLKGFAEVLDQGIVYALVKDTSEEIRGAAEQGAFDQLLRSLARELPGGLDTSALPPAGLGFRVAREHVLKKLGSGANDSASDSTDDGIDCH
jgi:hypothetical protein